VGRARDGCQNHGDDQQILLRRRVLQHKAAVSPVEDFTSGRFASVLTTGDHQLLGGAPSAAVQRQDQL
jgi:hypothetical protein